MANSKGVFVRRWNRMDEKLWKENGEENILEGVLLRKGEGKMMVGPTWANKKVLSKIERKLGGKKSYMWRTKMPVCKLHMRFFNMFVCLFFFFFFVCMWFFFSINDFYFLINLGDCMLIGCLSLFCFNWASFFNKGIWVNSYKLNFFYPSIFSLPTKQKWGKLKFF